MEVKVLAERTPQKDNATDAAAERETVIVWSDADQVVTVNTSQRPVITQLEKNPSARLIETDGTNFMFELSMGLVTLRKGKRAANKNGATVARVRSGAVCGFVKEDKTTCQSLAKKGTDRCRWHS